MRVKKITMSTYFGVNLATILAAGTDGTLLVEMRSKQKADVLEGLILEFGYKQTRKSGNWTWWRNPLTRGAVRLKRNARKLKIHVKDWVISSKRMPWKFEE